MPRTSLQRVAFGILLLDAGPGFGCASNYEPQGQFWPLLGSGGLGGSMGAGDQSGAGFPTAGSQGNVAGASNGTGGVVSTSSGGVDTSLGGSTPTGGSASASAGGTSGGSSESGGSSSTGGSSAAAGGGSSTGGNSTGGALATGGGSSTGGSSAGGFGGGGRSSGGGPGTGGSGFAGSSSAGGPATGGSGGASTSTTCSLSVSVTTTAPGGQYAPRNVGAIWVANATGGFVKSLEVWGNQRLSHVTAWNAATKAAGAAANKVDAITSATLSAHRTHNVTWNCQNYNRQPVADGTYRVYFEITDSNQSGPNHFESFAKGPAPVTVQGSSMNFNNISLVFKP